MVRMHLNGIAEVSVPKQPKVRLDVAQLRALAKIADRIEEMNRVMGH
jgi:ATP-dependent Clp protease adapter protein ClpS